jgi:hypothetical protein
MSQNQSKRILSNCNIKVALKPYLTLGHIFAKPKEPVKTNQKTHAVGYILYHAVTARKSIWVSLNASLAHGEKNIKRLFQLSTRENQL